MTQNEKDLLLKDLCARLPYGVKVKFSDSKPALLTVIEHDEFGWQIGSEDEFGGMITIVDNVKPYLFPLSSMTDEQIMHAPDSIHVSDLEDLRYDSELTKLNSRFPDLIDLIDWLNKNHFDYRGLIPTGLAEDATGKNIY